MNPIDLIDRFPRLEILVVGEAMLDSYLSGNVGRVCREAPVPIVALDETTEVPGGAANAAAAVAALGARTRFLSVVGQDQAGRTLLDAMTARGIDVSDVTPAPGRQTMVKQRVSAGGQLLMRLDTGSEHDVDAVNERRLIDALHRRWETADAVIVSDYGYGVCTPAVIAAIALLQSREPRVLVGDAKDLSRWVSAGLTAAKPNYEEAVRLLGDDARTGTQARVEQIVAARSALASKIGADILTVTLDRAGAVVLEGEREPYRTFTRPSHDSHAAGAGDTFTAVLALALAGGSHAAGAADLASAAATACLDLAGTTTCSTAMLRELVAGDAKAIDGDTLAAQVEGWRAAGKRIVFTNGCFDILHHGHITYLNRAKSLGDVLIVGLNSDASVRGLKGPTRPINRAEDRAAVLGALSCVDLVVPFDEPTPVKLIEAVRPHLFVKGGDYTRETLPEASLVEALGGEVKIMPFLDDRSTTGIIERIRRADAPLEAAG